MPRKGLLGAWYNKDSIYHRCFIVTFIPQTFAETLLCTKH